MILVGSVLLMLGVARGGVLGVPPSQQNRYSGATFTCDGSIQLASNRVNDDYCDCKDGSDEPGTSACPNGEFWCANVGFQSLTIPSMRVGDGVCDCCDGSDEGSGVCADTCESDGAEWRLEQERLARMVKEGSAIRATYASEGQSGRESLERELSETRAGLTQAEEKEAAAKLALEAAEEKEAAAKRKREEEGDAALYRGLGLLSLKAEEVRAALVRIVRRANASEDAVAVLRDMAAARTEGDEEAKNGAREGIVWPEDAPRDEKGANLDTFTLPEAEEARKELNEARKNVKDTENRIKHLEEKTGRDFGKDMAWAPLQDRCTESTIGKYKYKICPFEQATQDSTSLGTFKRWIRSPDDATAQDPPVMEFADGARCWQGPSRSVAVTFRCGLEEKIISADEPSKCTYEAVMETPAACDETHVQTIPEHDEL